MATATTIKFGDYLTVTDEGAGVIRVDGCPPGGAGGIQFDTSPQAGNWLFVEADDAGGSPNSYAIEFDAPSGDGIALYGVPVYIGDVAETSNGALFGLTGGGVHIDLTGAQYFDIREAYNGTKVFQVNVGGSGSGDFIYGLASAGTNTTPGGYGIEFNTTGSKGIYLYASGSGGIALNSSGGGYITISGLPTSTPGGTGRVWNNSGVLSIT